MNRLFPIRSIVLTLVIIGISAALCADTLQREPLFKIERSKNANIVQYDVQMGPDGKLDSKEPVVAYWVRLADEGQIKKLSWIQKTFAFGFNAKYDPDTDSAPLDMAVEIGREFMVVRDGDVYRAKTIIDGEEAFLDKIYIDAHSRGLFIKVEYVDIYGKDARTGEDLFEHYIP